MNKINWKIRFSNKQFLVSLIALVLVFTNQVASLFGVDITFITGEVTSISETVLLILGLIGVINDPTVNNGGILDISDSKQALTYTEPKRDDK